MILGRHTSNQQEIDQYNLALRLINNHRRFIFWPRKTNGGRWVFLQKVYVAEVCINYVPRMHDILGFGLVPQSGRSYYVEMPQYLQIRINEAKEWLSKKRKPHKEPLFSPWGD